MITITEETPFNRSKFILLCDFWDAYKTFELKQTTSVPEINGTIRPQIINALKRTVDNLELLDLSQLRVKVQNLINDNLYVITLDGGVVFNNNDFSIEITRACTKIKEANIGPYVRMPRPFSAHLSQQFINLKEDLMKSPKDKVILCDDGIGTAGTVKRILNGLKDVDVKVEYIVAVTNPNKIEEVEGIPVQTINDTKGEYNWLNERDLYWGLPRSGLSICVDTQFVGLGGIPYTINNNMVISRIGIAPNKAEQFRQISITANIIFWKLLEKFHGRRLEIRDCARLSFFSNLYREHEEVIKILNDCRQFDILNNLA